MMDVRGPVRAFLQGFLRNRVIGDDDDIFATGFVNSLLVMQLVTMVEREFGIQVTDDDLDYSNFSTIDKIAQFVARKRTPATVDHADGDAA